MQPESSGSCAIDIVTHCSCGREWKTEYELTILPKASNE